MQLAFAAAALFLVLAAASSAADAPSLSVSDASVTEGDSGTKNAVFTVVLSASSADPISIDYATTDGSARAPDDYVAAAGTVTFSPGELSKQVTVAVAGDTLDEPHETYALDLSNPLGVTVADGRGAGTILDNDPLVSLAVGDVTSSESNGPAVFTVSLSRASGKVVTVGYATADGSAAASADYGSRSGTLVFLAGDTSKTVSVPLTDDDVSEPDETFAVNLSSAVNATLADAQGAGTIVDDDAPASPPPPDENPPPPAEDPPPVVPPGGEDPPAEEPPVDPPNHAPDCTGVKPWPERLWTPNNKLRLVTLGGATDSDGDDLAYEIGTVTQDEVGRRGPDARVASKPNQVWLRAQRWGKGDGRVYRIEYTASDGHDASCGGTAIVQVPHDSAHPAAWDSGVTVNSFGF